MGYSIPPIQKVVPIAISAPPPKKKSSVQNSEPQETSKDDTLVNLVAGSLLFDLFTNN